MTKVTQISFEEGGGSGRRRIHLREISGDSESPLETVGQDLRAARVRRGDDLATVSRSLKIRKDHLEAVEEDNFSDLPGKTYAIGFVRSYAQYLGLDVTRMVERYKQEISGRRDEHAPADPGFHIEEPRRLPYGWRIVAGIVARFASARWKVGGDAPITVQSMTNTVTRRRRATIAQIRALEEAGADIVRVSCPDEDATKALKASCKAGQGADRRRHPLSTTSAPSRRPKRRGLPAHQSRQYRLASG
jgi:hypothetical protein